MANNEVVKNENANEKAKLTNEQIRVDATLNNVERQIDTIRGMTSEQIRKMKKEIAGRSKGINTNLKTVELLGGREIGDKTCKRLVESMPPELYEKIKEGLTFDHHPVKDEKGEPIRDKKGKIKEVYFSPETVAMRKISDKNETVEKAINKYEIRRENNIQRRGALNNMRSAIKQVERERRDAELAAKNIQDESIIALYKKMVGTEPQKVPVLVTA